jgi:2-polyprenyl-3-methyl-5-hydroxy-6-metoxy-1,4-benzoquinol methylase
MADDGSLAGVPEPAAPDLLPVERCPSCGAADHRPVLPAHGGIALVRCRGCELVHATAGYAPRFLDDHYVDRARRAPPSSAPSAPRPGSERKRHALELYDRLTGGRLCPAPPEGLALDIGCGPGLLLDLLREAGWGTVGIERSGAAEDAIAAGHRVLALDVEALGAGHAGSTEVSAGDALPERFGLVTLTHVLEHLRHPGDALRWVSSHLTSDGSAIVEVPNWEDLARPLWGSRYRPLELGDHVSFFDRRTLAAVAERAGLRVEALWSAPQARTLVFPSLLTGMDVVLGGLRRLRSGPRASEGGVGVASTRVVAGKGDLRHAAVTAALAGLDRLDPALERLAGFGWAHGANLVAVLRPA